VRLNVAEGAAQHLVEAQPCFCFWVVVAELAVPLKLSNADRYQVAETHVWYTWNGAQSNECWLKHGGQGEKEAQQAVCLSC
jgi:hypothetical protein